MLTCEIYHTNNIPQPSDTPLYPEGVERLRDAEREAISCTQPRKRFRGIRRAARDVLCGPWRKSEVHASLDSDALAVLLGGNEKRKLNFPDRELACCIHVVEQCGKKIRYRIRGSRVKRLDK